MLQQNKIKIMNFYAGNCLRICVVLILFFVSGVSFAQVNNKALALVEIDTTRIRIGEQAHLKLILLNNTAKPMKVDWPVISDTIAPFVEKVSSTPINKEILDKADTNRYQLTQEITLTSFDSGEWLIPQFSFIINGDSLNPVSTEIITLHVTSVPVDTLEKTLMDIVPPFEEHVDWKIYLPYIYWAVGILAALIIAFVLYRRYLKKKKNFVIPEIPKEPAHIIAFRDLERIEKEKIWKEGKVKEYYTDLTNTIRTYLENRFGVNALELTTDEIMFEMRKQVIDPASKNNLQILLAQSDLVKFAKATPNEEEHELALQASYHFVKGTLREEIVKPINPANA